MRRKFLAVRRNIARIEGVEVGLRRHGAPVFGRLEIEVDDRVDGAAVQEPQHFGDDERGGGRRAPCPKDSGGGWKTGVAGQARFG